MWRDSSHYFVCYREKDLTIIIFILGKIIDLPQALIINQILTFERKYTIKIVTRDIDEKIKNNNLVTVDIYVALILAQDCTKCLTSINLIVLTRLTCRGCYYLHFIDDKTGANKLSNLAQITQLVCGS